jgi:hypothetical protein
MKKSVKCFCGIPWNSIEFHEAEVDGIPWNSMEFSEFTEFDGIRFRQGGISPYTQTRRSSNRKLIANDQSGFLIFHLPLELFQSKQ